MPPLLPQKNEFELVSKGLHPAVCCEFADLGLVDTRYGKKPKGAWVFQVDETDEKGRRKEIRFRFNLVVGTAKKPSKVQKAMAKWRGREYTQAELENGDVDPERPVGQPCLLDVEHTTLDDGTEIHFVDMVLPPGEVRLSPENYVPLAEREKNRSRSDDGGDTESSGGSGASMPAATEGDIPF